MYKKIKLITAWYVNSTKRFFVAAPLSSMGIIFISLVSQISQMISILLPIKVILLLGSSRTPRYFPESFQLFERDQLIIWLSIASLVFSLIYIASNKIASIYITRNSRKLSQKSKKIVIYDDQDSTAVKAYGNFMQNLVNIIFTLLVISLLANIYPLLLYAVCAYLFAASIIAIVTFEMSVLFQNKLREDLSQILKIISSIGFYFSFAVIIIDFLFPLNPPSLIYAVIGFILVRRVLGNTTSTVVSIKNGYGKRNIIDSIFFSAKKKRISSNKNTDRLWQLLEPSRRTNWASEIINNELGLNTKVESVSWHQTGVKNMVAVKVKTYFPEKREYQYFFIKLYNFRKNMAAENDVILYKDANLSFLLLDFLLSTEVDGHPCHIFSSSEFINNISQAPPLTEYELTKELASYEPSKKLITYYMRAHPLLWQRLDKNIIMKLRLVANEEQLPYLEIFEQKIDNVKNILRQLPKQLVFSNVGFAKGGDEKLKLLTWSAWRLEPVGYGWSFKGSNVSELLKIIGEIKLVRPYIQTVDVNMVILSAICSKLEKLYQKDDFDGALQLLPLLLEQERMYVTEGKDVSLKES